MRLAPTRLVPFSYFCTCWNVRPNASPSFSWLMPSMMRRIRTRLPTYLSTGLGALVDISKHSWDSAPGMKQNGSGVCLRRRYRQILLGGSGRNADKLSNELTGSCFLVTGARMRTARSVCQLVDWRKQAFPERRPQPQCANLTRFALQIGGGRRAATPRPP